jgi:YD repeat-containing protein
MVNVDGFGNLTLTNYDGLNRPVETDTLLTPSGQGNDSFLGVDQNGVRPPIPNGYLATNQAGDGIISSYSAYDADSQLLASRDDNGNATASIYDNENRTVVQRQGLYLPGTSFTIAGGDRGTFPQAATGIATDQTNPSGTDTTTAYDLDGSVQMVTNQGDKTGIRSTLTYTVDALGRTTSLAITSPGGSTFVGTPRQTWQYDGLSRTTQEVNYGGSDAGNQHALPNVTTTRFYDSLSRQIEEQQQIGTPPAPLSVVSWNFDLAASGSADGASALVYPDGRQLDSRYDSLDRLVARYDDGFAANPIGTEQYLGPVREAVRSYQLNAQGNGVRLTAIGRHNTPNVDAGYDGDQLFVRQAWESYTATTPLGQNTDQPVIGLGYQFADGSPAYDRNNNLLVAQKLHDAGNAEVYHYRSDNELTSFQRGTLDNTGHTIQTATSTPGLVQSQDWLATRSQADH